MKHKGANAYSASYMIGGFVVFLTVVVIAAVFVQGGFLTSANTQGDLDEVGEIVSAMKNKCDDVTATEGTPSQVSTSVDVSFEEVERFEVTGSELVVYLKNDNSETFSLTGCDYEFRKDSSSSSEPWEGEWSFDISHEGNTQNPAVIEAVGTAQ